LSTDYVKARILKPFGWIDWLAQAAPTGLSMVATVAVAFATRGFVLASSAALALSASAWIVTAIAVLVIEYRLIVQASRDARGEHEIRAFAMVARGW
jgi:hypothetical protein